DSSMVLELKQQLKSHKLYLNFLMGRIPEAPLEISPSIPAFSEATLTLPSNIQSPAYLMAQYNVNIAFNNIKLAQSKRYPLIQVSGGYNYNSSESEVGIFSNNRSAGLVAGFTARLNLFDGGKLNREIKVAKQNLETAHIDEKQVLAQLDLEA